MSHFAVGIITRDFPTDSDIERALAPYDENIEVRTVITKEEIVQKKREEIENYKNTTYKRYLEDPEKYLEGVTNQLHIDYITKDFPKKLEWTDDECYQDYIQYVEDENILPNGDVVSYYNPKSKWDWYEVGGRWTGLLYSKKDEEYVDQTAISDIGNFYDEDAYKKAARFWELYIDKEQPVSEEEKGRIKNVWYEEAYYTRNYQTKENYAKCQAYLGLYAIIDEYGEWHAKGEMGWWGMSNQTENAEAEWTNTQKKMLEEAGEKGYFLTIVDCHI